MLSDFRKGVCVLAATLSFSAAAAQAEVHTVLILEGGYFPQKVYVNPGDTIEFLNDSPGAHRLTGLEANWVSDPIPPNQIYSLQLTDETPLTYDGIWPAGQVTETALPEGTIIGEISYDEPPLDEDPDILDEEYVN